jgi:hypothetical protein
MGYCQVGGNTQQCSQEDCGEFEGHYFDKPGDFPGGCFLLSVLGDERAILMAGTMMYPAMIQFRDKILRRTPLGRHLIGYFDKFYEEAKVVARKDPKLITEVVWLATYVSPFLQSMLGQKPARSSPKAPVNRLASQYRPGTHKAFASVVKRFKKAGASEQFATALDDSEQILARFVGMTPNKALRELKMAKAPTKPARRS